MGEKPKIRTIVLRLLPEQYDQFSKRKKESGAKSWEQYFISLQNRELSTLDLSPDVSTIRAQILYVVKFLGGESAPVDRRQIISLSQKDFGTSPEEAEKVIAALIYDGDLYCPKKGMIRATR